MPEQSNIEIEVKLVGLEEAESKIAELNRIAESVAAKLDRARATRCCRCNCDLAEAQRGLVAELKRQNDLAERIQRIAGREAVQALASIISGQIVEGFEGTDQ